MNQPPQQPPGGPPPGGPLPPQAPQKPASMARYKRELRKEIKRRAHEPEINFLNITAMLDMMTIILVFLLKSLTSSTAAIPQSDDLKMPESMLTTAPESEPEGLAIVISKSHIIVGERAVCPVPPDSEKGIEAKYKRGTRNDYRIVPLENALQAWRDTDRKIRAATKKDPSYSEAIVISDNATPYRLLFEVLFTLGQNEFSKQHILVLQSSKKN